MPYLSKAQIAAAREMDLLTYLRQSEPEELVHIGGGTYAKEMPNMLAFGNQFPGENTHIHEVDERWSVEHIVKNTKIMAAAIAALAGVEE